MTSKRYLEDRVDFLEVTVGKLWDDIYNLQGQIDKLKELTVKA